MAELIQQIIEFIQNLISAVGYPGIFLALFLENVFPPIPTDGLLPISGILAAEGRMTYPGVIASAVFGAVLGSLLLYGIGAWADERVVRALVRRWGRLLGMTEANLDLTLERFKQYGAPLIFFGRWLPLMRTVLSLAAGISRMPLGTFLLLTTTSTTVSSGIWVTVGYLLGENWPLILRLIKEFEPLIIVGILVVGTIGVSYVVYRLLRGRITLRKQTEGGK